MKTMNYLFTAVFVLLLSACTNEGQTTEQELESTKYQANEFQEGGEFTELSLHRQFLETELIELNCELEQQMDALEQGDDSMAPIVEQTMMNISENGEHQDIIDELIAKRCPKGSKTCPAPRPNPCTQEKGCQFSCPIRIPDLLNIWVPEDHVDGTTIQVFDVNGRACSGVANISAIEGSNGMVGMTLETDGCCGGYIEVTKPFEYVESGEVTYRVDVQCE